jgi:serine/threonine protein kinase
MNPSELLELLEAVLRGEAQPDSLFAAIDDAVLRSPEAADALRAAIDDLYGRNEIHFDLYLRIKDALTLTQPPRRTIPPPAPAETLPKGAPPAGHGAAGDATRLRTPAQGDRTVLRSATRPPPREPIAAGASIPPVSTRPGPHAPETPTWVIEQPLEPGSVIKSRFVLDRRLGEGGMGVVFKARDLRKEEARDRDPYLAIKFLNAEFRRHPEALMALQRETRRAQALAHPNIITVYDFDRDGTLIYMTMEYLEGEPLDRYILRHPQGVRFKEAWPIIEGCSRALSYAHEQGVVHADFKPGNVFVSGERRVKVLDFGIARAVQHHGIDPAQGTRFDAASLGALTPAYASPEMLLGEQPDPRDDVYALACVSYELMTGRHPFDGETAVKAAHDAMPVKRTRGMTRRQHRALARGLAFRQADRSKSVEAFLDEIAGPLGARGRAARQAIFSIAVTAVVVAGVAGGVWWTTRSDPDIQLARQLSHAAQLQLEEERARGRAVEQDLELRDVLLEQGHDYLTLAEAQFDPVLLSEGVSSAYGAFRNALQIDPTNEAAVQGIVEIVRRYHAEAARLFDAGDFDAAVRVADYGLRIHPTRESLADLRAKAEARRDAEK